MLNTGQTPPGYVERADDDCQHVIEVMSNATGELTDGLKLLKLSNLTGRLLSFCDFQLQLLICYEKFCDGSPCIADCQSRKAARDCDSDG